MKNVYKPIKKVCQKGAPRKMRKSLLGVAYNQLIANLILYMNCERWQLSDYECRSYMNINVTAVWLRKLQMAQLYYNECRRYMTTNVADDYECRSYMTTNVAVNYESRTCMSTNVAVMRGRARPSLRVRASARERACVRARSNEGGNFCIPSKPSAQAQGRIPHMYLHSLQHCRVVIFCHI